MDNELFELCRDVYERTGWLEADYNYYEVYLRKEIVVVPNGNHTINRDGPINFICPSYNSDYLLLKLANHLTSDKDLLPFVLYRSNHSKEWIAGYDGYFGGKNDPCDTPLKALLKLVIALDDAKELK